MTAQIINLSEYHRPIYPDSQRNLEAMSLEELDRALWHTAKMRGNEMLHNGLSYRHSVLNELFDKIQAEIDRRNNFVAYNAEWQRQFTETFGGDDDTAA